MRDPPRANRAQILRAVTLIAAPGQVVELRALGVRAGGGSHPITMSGYFDDLALLADAAARLRGAQGIYITLNPFDPALLARSPNRLQAAKTGGSIGDTDISARRWLPVDADPLRPADVSASDAEHRAALAVARKIRETLTSLGWPAPLLADSGNGGHLLYRIDLPRDPAARGASSDGGLVARVLAALALLFDDEQVQIDQRVHNPGRIWKLYGTVARKGAHTEDRPHRLARLLEVPAELLPVPRELLEQFATSSNKLLAISHKLSAIPGLSQGEGSHKPSATGSQQSSRANRKSSISFPLDSWLTEHAVPVSGPRPWGDGGRRWIFRNCPWNRRHHGSAYIVQLPNGAIAAGCLHNSCRDKGWRELRAIYDCRLRIADCKNPVRPAPPAVGQAVALRDSADPPGAHSIPGAGGTAPGQSKIGNLQSEISSWPPARDPAAKSELEARAVALADECAGLSRADLLCIVTALRGLGCRRVFIRQWLAAVRERQRSLSAPDEPASGAIYEADDGHIYRLTYEITPAGEPRSRREVVADFALRIAEEIVAEDGRVWFALEGRAADGRSLRAELPAADFADDRALQAVVTSTAGPRCPVRAGMIRHLRPAIQLLTDAEVPRVRRFDRTGWAEEFFLIPGREPPGVVVRLPRKLPYHCDAQADLAQGLIALEAALNAADPRRTTVLMAAMLGAPLARPAALQGERYGVFLSGRTGSLKTSTAQALMCLFGAGFIEDQYLLKLGEGATRNAIMGYAARVYDLPLLIDNYKPSTGDGARGFVNLLHNLLEGGERERMTRSADLRETRPVHCWPVFTGEDVPDTDTAGLARLLILPFEPPRGDPARLAALSRAQTLSAHLPAAGGAWLAWLEGEGAAIAAEAGARFPEMRARWLDHLHGMRADMANPFRVASSLACNELAWQVLRRHPEIGALAARFDDAHTAGLLLTAGEMAGRTAVSLEAVRFLAVLRELLATGRFELIPREVPQRGGRRPVGNDAPGNSLRRGSAPDGRTAAEAEPSGDGRPGRGRMTPQGTGAGAIPERTLGWECPDGSIYLLPELARREVERVLGPGGLNAISSRTLHEQLSELGLIASRDPGRFIRRVREGGRLHNVLHLLPDALEG